MAFEKDLPVLREAGSELPESIKNNGWSPEDPLAAQHLNYMFNKTYEALEELQENAAEKNEVNQQLAQDKQVFYFGKELLLQAHRVCEYHHAENCIPALYKAKELGYDVVEIDVRKTSDNVYILMHDATVDRTTNGTGNVSSMTWAQIQALEIDQFFAGKNSDEKIRVPSLNDFMKVASELNMVVNIDLYKEAWTQTEINEIYEIVSMYNMVGKTVWNCWFPQTDYVIEADPNCIVVVAGSNNMTAEEIITRCALYKYKVVAIDGPLNKETSDAIKKHNIPSFIFNVNTNVEAVRQAVKNGNALIETSVVLKEDFNV